MINRRLLALARNHHVSLLITLCVGFMGGLLTIGQAWTLSSSVDAVFLGGKSLVEIQNLLGGLLLIIIGRALMVWLGAISAGQLARQVKSVLRKRLFQHVLKLGPNFARGERTGELINTTVEGIEALDAWFREYLPQLVLAVLIPVTILCFVFPRDLLTGIVLLVTAPLIPVFMILIGNLAEAKTKRQWKTLSYLSSHFFDVLQGLTTLKIFGRSREQIQEIERISEDFRKRTMDVLQIAFLSALVLEIVATLSTAVVAVEIGLRLLYGRIAFQDALFVLLLAPEFYLPLRMLGTRFHAGTAGAAASERIFEILDRRPETEDRAQNVPVPRLPSTVIFDHVHFSYEMDRAALRDISFTIEPGQKVALVGPSGAGKSTIAQLLLGFIQPKSGDVFTPDELKKIAWLPQQAYLFNDTIANNIGFAKPGAGMDEIVRAAKSAYAHEFIQALSQGYDTPIGEQGLRLSGGQAQRIALARAFLMDAPFVILDEPTSHLDPELEAQIHEATQELLQGRTALIIAHRLNTVVAADKIIVLEEGKVIGQGPHEQLLESCAIYAEMVGRKKVSGIRYQVSGKTKTEDELQISTPEPNSSTIPHQPSTINFSLHTLQRLLSFLSGSWKWIALSVLLGFATIASSIGLMGTSAYIISAAALQPSIAALQVPIVGVRFFGISRGVFRYLERLVTHQVTFRLLARMRVWFYEKLEPLAPARLVHRRFGDLLSRILNDIDALENFYSRVLSPPLVALLIALLGGTYLAGFDMLLAMTLWGLLILAGFGVSWLVFRLNRKSGIRIVNIRADLNIAIKDGIQGMADLLAFGRHQDHARLIDRFGHQLGRAQKSFAFIDGMQNAFVNLLSNLVMWLVLVMAIPFVSSGQIDGVYLATLILVAFASFESVSPLPQSAQYSGEILEAAQRLFDIAESKPGVEDSSQTRLAPPNVDLSVRDLSFKYEKDANLQSVSFDLPPGKKLAIVGPSGAGKSTLLNLLLRFWEFEQGEILMAGQDLRSYGQEDVRACFGVVSQRTHLFSGSVRENLLLARPDAAEDQIVAAARMAEIDTFFGDLPEGDNTWIGESGLKLSGGERQRLALARALLKDAPILLLDEPTANLDPITEKQVIDAVLSNCRGRSILLISHRLIGMEKMDEILVMREGKIAERGTHAELLARKGFYARMWSLAHQYWT